MIAAPITSSLVRPAGISWAVTSSSGCSAFHASTIALPHSSSKVLFESQIVIGPRDSSAPAGAAATEAPVPKAPQASPITANPAIVVRFIMSSWLVWIV